MTDSESTAKMLRLFAVKSSAEAKGVYSPAQPLVSNPPALHSKPDDSAPVLSSYTGAVSLVGTPTCEAISPSCVASHVSAKHMDMSPRLRLYPLAAVMRGLPSAYDTSGISISMEFSNGFASSCVGVVSTNGACPRSKAKFLSSTWLIQSVHTSRSSITVVVFGLSARISVMK